MMHLIRLHKTGPAETPVVLENERGSAMIYLIGVILIMSVLGAAMINLMSTSTLGQVSANHLDRAYFMAESGFRYVFGLVKDDIVPDGTYDDIHGIHNRTFILDGGSTGEEGRFRIKVADDPEFVLVTSIGSIGTGVSTDVEAQVTYRLEKIPGSVFSISIFSDGELIIKHDVYIEGDVGTNDEDIDTGTDVTITGVEETIAEKILDAVVFFCADCESDETISDNETWPEEGIGEVTYEYKNLEIKNGVTITIKGDVTLYVKEDLIVRNGATFLFHDNASLTVYVAGSIDFDQGFTVEFDPGPDRPEDFVIFGTSTSNDESIIFRQDATFIGAVYAPGSNIDIKNGSTITGALVGGTIIIHNGSTIIFDPAVETIITPVDVNMQLSNPVQYFSR